MRANDIRNIRNESEAVLSTVSISLRDLFMVRSPGGGLEEAHGSVHNGGDCSNMEGFQRGVHEGSNDDSGDKGHDGQGDPQSGINGHPTKYVGMSNER
jgi:hypothetical protein